MKNLFTGVAGMVLAGGILATQAEAQTYSPVPSGMQPQSTFTPPPGATAYRQNQDGSSTQISREEFMRGTQQQEPSYQQPRQDDYRYRGYEEQRSEAYYEGYGAVDQEIERRRQAERYYARGPGDQVGCAASFNNGSWLNRGYGAWDRSLGRDGREVAGVLGLRGADLTARAQTQCHIDRLDGDARDRAQGADDRHQRDVTERRLQREAARRLFGRSP